MWLKRRRKYSEKYLFSLENLSQNGFVWDIFKSPEFIQSSELLADFAFDLWSSASLSLFKRDPSLLKMS